ncbi:FAD-binding monooxygenase [Paractinoplanes abujensis]|uniref:2-polyprenyl-6-methoxyphenol hydroxylase-like FAD-dependent oxidoreductase n=1 Tax=Paractinoplanes abujensis TaxID=882441 RepID=A0A7W7D1B3_9ACTN|nr:FAD-dependent oxidoreductase [Actinoplanes abujensis]MBB4696921.1 2-polyprenyl-6-methoxyphenol hydroxylase-like FAD-dependent oxidoreductase [Actinoplanes abujensis]GID18607.1 FAD-binding monooxygenase [Actinoplanes abujensis]
MALRVVISGASIAGLSAAYWLRRTGWEVIVIERARSFRDGGQNVDVRGVAREVLDRMGLFDAVKAQNTTETGTVLVDSAGAVRAELPSDGPDSATAELEVLRGDLARTIRDHLPDGIEFRYGETIAEVTDGVDEVAVTTSSGHVLHADLLVIAEGVGSTTRNMLFGSTVDRRELGITMVFGTIPRTPTDDNRWRWYNTVGGRQIHLRPDNHGTTRAILSYAGDDDLSGLDQSEALARLRERYADAGWEAPRILDAFDTSDDIYIDHLTQIRMSTWHRGRVVLAGDAGWCVTPLGGGGASLALTSGYVLAAYFAQQPGDRRAALTSYEEWMRPLVEDVQKLPPGIQHFAYPRTRFGLAVRSVVDKALTSSLFKPVAAKLTQVAQTDQQLPDMARV